MNDDSRNTTRKTTPTTEPTRSSTVGGFSTSSDLTGGTATSGSTAGRSTTGGATASRSTSPPSTTAASSKPSTAGEELGSKAREKTDQAAAAAREAGHEAKEVAKDAGKSLKREAQKVTGKAKAELTKVADRQTTATADRLGTVAGALRRAGEELESGEESSLAGVTQTCAGEIDRWAGYLRDRDIGRIAHDVSRHARRHPEIFLGATFGAGILLGRFLRSSQHHGNDGNGHSPALRYDDRYDDRLGAVGGTYRPAASAPPATAATGRSGTAGRSTTGTTGLAGSTGRPTTGAQYGSGLATDDPTYASPSKSTASRTSASRDLAAGTGASTYPLSEGDVEDRP